MCQSMPTVTEMGSKCSVGDIQFLFHIYRKFSQFLFKSSFEYK